MIELYWTNSQLTIHGSNTQLEQDLLFINKKELTWNASKFRRETQRKREQMFQVIDPGPVNRVISTLQGFKNRVIHWLHKHKIDFKFYDHRLAFAQPQMNRAEGFWCNQEQLFRQLLSSGESGLMQAPTRYGKTIMIANACRVFPNETTVIAAPGVDLLGQLVTQLQDMLPGREVRGIYTGSRSKKMSDDITVCSFDSLDRVDPEHVRLVLVDEPHAAVADSRAPLLAKFHGARIYGFGATLHGRFDGMDDLIKGLIGPILAKRTYKEAVAEGAILPITVYFLKMPFKPWSVKRRDKAYEKLMYQNTVMGDVTHRIFQKIPEDWQTLAFIERAEQATMISRYTGGAEVAMAGKMNKKDRVAMMERMAANELKRCICSKIYIQGVTFPDLRVLVNLAGGGGSITSVQKPGRLAQKRPGKDRGYLIDFLFQPTVADANTGRYADAWKLVTNDCWSRFKTYREIGYDVKIVDSISEIDLNV